MSNENRRIRQQSASKPSFRTEIPSDDSGKNGDVVYVRTNNGIENYIKDEGRWVSLNSTRPANEKPYISQVSKKRILTSSSGRTSMPSTFVSSLSNSSDETNMVGLVEDSTGTIYSLKGGDNISINVEGTDSSDYVEIDCSINTGNFLANSVNRLEGVRKHSGDAFDFTQSAGSGKYLVIDDDNSNVSVTESTVTLANGTSYNALRLNAPNVTNTNYFLDGITKSGNTLTFSVSGASNQTYTFGSNAFNSTSYLTGITSTLATNESASPARVSLLDNSSTICALEEGSGISIEESATGGGNTVKISSTVNTSGLLTNGIVTIQTHNGSEVEDSANASGGDILRFVENNSIEWAVSGPTSNVITITPTLSGYNSTNWNTAYNDRYKWDGGSSGLTASTGRTSLGLTGNSNTTHYHDGRYYTESELDAGQLDNRYYTESELTNGQLDGRYYTETETNNLLGAKAALSGATFTGDISAPNVKSTTSGIIKAIAGTSADRSGLTIYNSGESGYLSYTVTTSDHASGWGWELSNQAANATSPTYSVRVDYSGSTMKVKGDVIAYVSSDPKLKTNKELINKPLDKLMKLGGYSFDWKEEATKHGNHLVGHDYGVMADEVEALFPELVTTRENDGETMKAVDYKKLIPLLIESVKDLTNKLVQRGVLDEEL